MPSEPVPLYVEKGGTRDQVWVDDFGAAAVRTDREVLADLLGSTSFDQAVAPVDDDEPDD